MTRTVTVADVEKFRAMRTARLAGYINCVLRQVDPAYERIDAARSELVSRGISL